MTSGRDPTTDASLAAEGVGGPSRAPASGPRLPVVVQVCNVWHVLDLPKNVMPGLALRHAQPHDGLQCGRSLDESVTLRVDLQHCRNLEQPELPHATREAPGLGAE